MRALTGLRGASLFGIVCLLLTQAGGVAPAEVSWPPPPDTPARIIHVSLDTWHAMIAFPIEDSPSPTFEEWGYAEGAWYLEGRQGFTGVLRALFWPTEGVVEVGRHARVWAERTPEPPADLFTFRVSEEGYRRIRSYLSGTIADASPILVSGTTTFYPAKRSYHVFHTCHQYVAHALREAGLPISPFWAFTPAGLTTQLEDAQQIASNATGP